MMKGGVSSFGFRSV